MYDCLNHRVEIARLSKIVHSAEAVPFANTFNGWSLIIFNFVLRVALFQGLNRVRRIDEVVASYTIDPMASHVFN